MPHIIHLGVIDQFYTTPSTIGAKNTAVSTGEVATWLENKYGVMEAFAKLNSFMIATEMEKSLSKAIRTVALGGPQTTQPFAGAMSKIETAFKDFLSNSVIEKLGIPGVPTKAALDGKSSRTKIGRYKARKGKAGQKLAARRPSFIDTGLYQSSFKAWYEKR